MKISSVSIRNLRSFKDVSISLNQYTCLVGPNGAGKSNVLCALNVFFRETEHSVNDLTQLCTEDFHQKETKEPIEITVTFCDLSEEAQKDFADYYRQGKLVVSAIATFNENSKKAEVKQFGQRLGMEDFAEFFKAEGDGAKVSDLKDIYSRIRQSFSELPDIKTKETMIQALREYETNRPEACILIPSEDQFYGVSKGANRLAKYIQWVYIPAVKDAAAEQMEARHTALGKILARTVRSKTDFDESIQELRNSTRTKYQSLLDDRQKVLSDISASLQSRLVEWAHPEAKLKLEWLQDDKSIRVEEPWACIIAGEGQFEGALTRFGHGLQRSYLLALLHELASSDDSSAPTLILGCEEPELYQHPPQARHLAAVFQKLSQANSQIVVTTHNPLFVSGEGFEDVRLVRKDSRNKCSYVSCMTYKDISIALGLARNEPPKRPEGTLAKIHQALQPALSEIFFCSKLILVEGPEDVAYITSYLHLLGMWDEYRRVGFHIVPVNGKSELLQPLVIAKGLNIPTYTIFDSDADQPDKNGSRAKHEKDNKGLLSFLGLPLQTAFPQENIWGNNFVMWKSNIGSIIEEEIGTDIWAKCQEEADKYYGHIGGLRKNTLHIGASLSFAWDQGKRIASLEKLCDALLNSDEDSLLKAA